MKKLFVVFFSLIFALSVLLGCGKDNKANAPVQQPTTAVQTNKTAAPAAKAAVNDNSVVVKESGTYTDKERVAKYIHKFKKLPSNYITKAQAKKLGWQQKGTLDKVAPGKSIGGDRYGDYEGKLPKASNRKWTECDIDYVKGSRNAKRIVYSTDGLIYYTGDHYKTFTKVDVK